MGVSGYKRMVIKELESLTRSEVEQALQTIPTGLDAIYNRMLLQIHLRRQRIVAEVLAWVVMAIRPLSLEEVGIAIGSKGSEILGRNETVQDQVGFCGALIQIAEPGHKVGLVHQSLKDYLLRKGSDGDGIDRFRVEEDQMNSKIAHTCLNYMQNGAFSEVSDSNISLIKTWDESIIEACFR